MPDDTPLFDRLLKVQERIGKISKDKTNPFFESKYADINIIIEMAKPILNEEGILFMQPLSNVDGKPAITTILMHGTESIEYTTVFPDLPKPKEGKKSNPSQEMGSAITYYRRYALISILGLEAEDDDGNAAAPQSAPKKEQPKAQPKAQSKQAGSEKEIPTCSICQLPMKKTKPGSKNDWFCKHEKDGKVKWGKPVYNSQQVVSNK